MSMKLNLLPLLPICTLFPLLLSVFCFKKAVEYRSKPFRHLAEFILAAVTLVLSSWLLLPLGPAFIILSMVPWIWMLRCSGLVVQDIADKKLFSKIHLYILSFGAFVSILFLIFGLGLPMITAPFSASLGLIGLSFILQVYFLGRFRDLQVIHHFVLMLFLGFFVTRISFPLLVSVSAGTEWMVMIECYFILAFCLSLYPLYAQMVFEGQEQMLERTLEKRNKQLLSHSGFSEFKTLSAGLAHEINNSLTILHAKLSRMKQGKSRDVDEDLKIMQNATNRITASIRGLRHFIYPDKGVEIVDLDELLREVLSLYGQRLINHGVRLKMDSFAARTIQGERVLIEQVFLSLINNSVDALDKLDDKWISMSARIREKEIHIIYQDSSPSRAKILEPILQDPLHVYHDFKDNDIRVILAKEIMEQHGGRLEVMAGEITTYLLIFPLTATYDALTPVELNLNGSRELRT